MTGLDLAKALALARQAADAGAEVAMRKRESSEHLTVRAKGKADWVTDVDHAAQAAIIEIIRSAYPDHRFLAEEEGADALGDQQSPFCWIIDPLDGTTPYIHGSEHFGTIIALQENDTTIIGAMTIPMRDERFWSRKGDGAYLNGKRITSLRATQSMDDAIICANLGRHTPCYDVAHFRCSSLHCYGCAATMAAELLKGHNDGLILEGGPHLWDTAAACLMIAEAGGRVREVLEDPLNRRGSVFCVASTPPIFEELCRVLNP